MIQFSIIIPTRNRAKILAKVLLNLLRLDYPKYNFEVLIIDNDSTDNTFTIVKRFIEKHKEINFKLLKERKIGPSFARNKGIQNAKNPVIVCLDDDVIVSKDLLTKYSRILANYPKTAIIGGKVVAISRNQRHLDYLMELLAEDRWVFSETTRIEEKSTFLSFPDDLISANLLINRNIFKGRLFNEKFGKKYASNLVFSEDIELCLRALKDNKQVIYDPSIISKHYIGKEKLNFNYIFSRFYRAGIEQSLLEKELGVRLYIFDFKKFLKLMFKYIRYLKLKYLLKFIREILLFAGYNLASWSRV